jgi:hypothetical protein
MTKRSFFLALAGGLIACMAFAAPSQAGSLIITTDAKFGDVVSGPEVTAIQVTYNVSTFIGLTETSGPAGSFTTLGDTVTFTFTTAQSFGASLAWTFETPTPPSPGIVGVTSYNVLPTTSAVSPTLSVTVSQTAVPEPASMALLGIVAFRRFLKRNRVA